MTILTVHNAFYYFVVTYTNADRFTKKEIEYFHSIGPLNNIFISKDILFVF